MTKHILHIVENNSVPDDRRVWAEALAGRQWGYQVSVVCPKTDKNAPFFERIQGIDVYRYPYLLKAKGRLFYFLEYLFALIFQFSLSIRVFCRKRFHILHSANPPDNIVLIAIFFKLFGVKYVFDHHDLCTELYLIKFARKDPAFWLTSFFETLSIKTADMVISTNESYKNAAILKAGKDPKKVVVVRNGPDLEKMHSRLPAPDYKNGFRYMVGYIGIIASQESMDILLKIVSHIVHIQKIRDVKFVIMGKGPGLAGTIALARQMDIADYIDFTGFVPYPELMSILKQCDIGINPEPTTLYSDKSTMLKIMDYMLAGKPLIQFKSTEGQVTAAESSLYITDNDEVDFAFQLVELLNDPERCRKMGEAGRQRIKNYLHWGIQKQNLKKVYESL